MVVILIGRSAPIGVSQLHTLPLHSKNMISDNKLDFQLNFIFYLLDNSECRIKDEDTIVCLFQLRFAIIYK